MQPSDKFFCTLVAKGQVLTVSLYCMLQFEAQSKGNYYADFPGGKES